MGLAPCKKRRRLEVILGQQETLNHIARAGPAPFKTRMWCFDRDLLRGPFRTYRPSPRTLSAAIGPALEAIVPSPVAFGPAEL